MINGENFFDQPIKNNEVTLEKLLLVKEMITQQAVCRSIHALKIVIKCLH